MENLSALATLRELECELHQPECRKNRERLAQLLARGFKEFGRSGASYTRDHTLISLTSDPNPSRIHAQDFVVRPLSDSIALLTYRDVHVSPSGKLFLHTNWLLSRPRRPSLGGCLEPAMVRVAMRHNNRLQRTVRCASRR